MTGGCSHKTSFLRDDAAHQNTDITCHTQVTTSYVNVTPQGTEIDVENWHQNAGEQLKKSTIFVISL